MDPCASSRARKPASPPYAPLTIVGSSSPQHAPTATASDGSQVSPAPTPHEDRSSPPEALAHVSPALTSQASAPVNVRPVAYNAAMSTGGRKPSRVVLQDSLFGGTDVLELFSGAKRNVLHCSNSTTALRQATALSLREGSQLAHVDDVPRLATCPRCGASGDTQSMFGTRLLRGRRVPQSWCRSCRRRD